MMTQHLSDLRKQILDSRKVTLPKHTRVSTTPPPPDLYPTTTKMKYLAIKYHIELHFSIFTGSLDDAVQLFGYEVDRSTISRWRKHILKYVTFHEETNGTE